MVDPTWSVEELLERYPASRDVLARYGMWCPICALAGLETLADAARVYGVPLDRLLGELEARIRGEGAAHASGSAKASAQRRSQARKGRRGRRAKAAARRRGSLSRIS